MDKLAVIIALLLVVLIAVCSVAAFNFAMARQEIASYNKKVIESCMMMVCNMTFWGDLHCSEPIRATELVGGTGPTLPVLDSSPAGTGNQNISDGWW